MPKSKNRGNRKQKKGKQVKKNVAPSLTNNADLRQIAGPRRQPSGRKPKTAHVRSVCSVTDPFCPAAKNSKWPDGTSGNTLTEQFRGNVTLSADAQGYGFAVFAPTAPYGYTVATVAPGPPAVAQITAAGVNQPWQTYKANSMLATYGGNCRTVSAGFIVRNVASATNSAGIITVGTNTAPAASMNFTLGSELYNEVAVKAIQPGMEMSFVSQPRGTGARDFNSQTAYSACPTDWSCLFIEISGANAGIAVVNVEWFINIEFEPYPDKRELAALAKPNPPKSTAAEASVSRVHSSLGSLIEGGVSSVESAIAKHATDALNSLFSDPLESLAALFSM